LEAVKMGEAQSAAAPADEEVWEGAWVAWVVMAAQLAGRVAS
jgi:hypothetical protein